MKLSSNLDGILVMTKLQKIYYAACFYILSASSFADSFSGMRCDLDSTLSKYSLVIVVPIFILTLVIGITRQNLNVVINGAVGAVMLFLAPKLISVISGQNMNDCAVESADGPETHYLQSFWQAFLNFILTCSYLIIPCLVVFFLFGIIGQYLNKSKAVQGAQIQSKLIQRKSGELLFYLNKLYQQFKDSNDTLNVNARMMDLICKVHESQEKLTLLTLREYIKEYRSIRLLLTNTQVK